MVCTLIDHRNDAINVQNLAVKPLASDSWFHLSFEYFMASSLWSIRKAREAFLILKSRTVDPHGLNIREETY